VIARSGLGATVRVNGRRGCTLSAEEFHRLMLRVFCRQLSLRDGVTPFAYQVLVDR